MQARELVIDLTDGVASFVLDDDTRDLLGLGAADVRRASNVVPENRLLRVAFRALRNWFGDAGRVAAFTRSWSCRWLADMGPSGGAVLGPFQNRSAALNAERAWIRKETGL